MDVHILIGPDYRRLHKNIFSLNLLYTTWPGIIWLIINIERWNNEQSSQKEVLGYLVIDIMQAGLLIFTIVYLFHAESYRSGQIFSIVTYVMMLNENTCAFNEIIIEIADLIDSTNRLNSGANESSWVYSKSLANQFEAGNSSILIILSTPERLSHFLLIS